MIDMIPLNQSLAVKNIRRTDKVGQRLMPVSGRTIRTINGTLSIAIGGKRSG